MFVNDATLKSVWSISIHYESVGTFLYLFLGSTDRMMVPMRRRKKGIRVVRMTFIILLALLTPWFSHFLCCGLYFTSLILKWNLPFSLCVLGISSCFLNYLYSLSALVLSFELSNVTYTHFRNFDSILPVPSSSYILENSFLIH